MIETTPHLALPLIMPSQAQKHITHNEAIQQLDALVLLSVLSSELSTPPTEPASGERYIVGPNASASWAGYEDHIAVYQTNAWSLLPPQIGWRAWDIAKAVFRVWDGQTWRCVAGSQLEADAIGIHTQPSAYNRLAIASHASLFTHDGQDHRLVINKNSAGHTASTVFQKGYSGRAEIGLTGDENFHVNVSANGNDFHEAIRVDRHSGKTTISALEVPGYWRWYNSAMLTVAAGTMPTVCVFDSASHNPSGAYDINTGQFTAPEDGLYCLIINFKTDETASVVCDIMVNGQSVGRIETAPAASSHMSKTQLISLAQNDVMTLRVAAGGAIQFDGGGAWDNISVLRLGVL